LISAHYEKQVAFARAANKYAEYDGRGQAVIAAALKAATDRGNARYAALIGEARNRARTELSVGRTSYDTSVQQGRDESPIARSVTDSVLAKLFTHTTEFVSLVQEIVELEYGARYGRYVTVDRDTGQFTLHERSLDDATKQLMNGRLTKLSQAKRQRLEEVKAQAISEGALVYAEMAGMPYCR
jgi:hypothetical protein